MVEVTGTSPDDTPSQLTFRFEARVTNPLVEQEIFLFNYDTQGFDSVDQGIAPQADTIINTVINNNPSRYVEAGTGEVKARIEYSPQGLSSYYGLRADIDQTAWIVP